MKKTIIYMSMLAMMLIGMTACESEKVYYEGPNYVQFSDSLLDMPVTTNEGRLFDIYGATTQSSETDRYYAVDVDLKRTNAIEGYHFDIVSRNVLIKAGERTGKVTLKGSDFLLEKTPRLSGGSV